MNTLKKHSIKITAALLAVCLAGGGLIAAGAESPEVTGSAAAAQSQTLTPRQVYEMNCNAVVSISATVTTTSYGQTVKGTVSGSGFIISSDGYVVTNCHVIEDTDAVTVTVSSGEEYPAEIVGYDASNDVAVLKIDAQELPSVILGNSDDLYIGDMVVAIGNPLGSLTATLTVGYCSGKDREVTTDNTIINMIQTDAAINSGSSGGPLFNMYGEVVGITTAKYSGTTSSGASIEGVSFAIPINDVMKIIADLRDYGYVTGAYLGITVQDSDADAAKYYGMPTGAYVVSVVDGYGAAAAGLKEKDIIIGIGEYTVSSVNELTRALKHFESGDETTLTIIRSGERLELSITLSERPQDLNKPATTSTADQPSSGNYEEWYHYFFDNIGG